MKKQLCIVLSLLLCLGVLYACEEEKSNISDTSVQGEVSNVSSIPEESTIPDDSSAPEESVVPDENSQVLEELPPLPDDEAETVVLDDDDYVYGKITEKWSNALTLKLDTPRMIEEWGEYVYIITDEGADWCVGDEIDVRLHRRAVLRIPNNMSVSLPMRLCRFCWRLNPLYTYTLKCPRFAPLSLL